jgi:aquaporin NIP
MRKYLAEFIGTFALVFCGTGAVIINDVSGGAVTHVGIAITFGLIIMAMIFAVGEISGAHMNPAVTLAFTVAGKFSPALIIPYILSQIAGAFFASGALRFLFPDHALLGATMPAGSEWQSFVLEFILTFLLMLVIFRMSDGGRERGITAALAIGGVVLLEAMFAGPVCGASMNPARSLAPAIVSGHLEHLWIYLAAPVGGALAAAGVNRIFEGEKL